MVKVIYSYQCEICHTVYDTEELAVSCNADSVPEPKYEKGIQYTDMQNKSWKVEEIQISSVQVGPKKRRHTIIYISRNENGNKETITEKK